MASLSVYTYRMGTLTSISFESEELGRFRSLKSPTVFLLGALGDGQCGAEGHCLNVVSPSQVASGKD